MMSLFNQLNCAQYGNSAGVEKNFSIYWKPFCLTTLKISINSYDAHVRHSYMLTYVFGT